MKDDFIKAALKKRPGRVPLWFMRQAGRYIPDYLELRRKYSMIELIKDPKLSAKVTLFPFKYFDLDAAILFSDLLVILWGFNIDFELEKGEGPFVKGDKISNFSLKNLKFIEEEIKILKKELGVPLIGFTAAPFTLLSYLIEKSYKRDFPETRKFMYKNQDGLFYLMDKISRGIEDFLKFQADAGCDALMLFDSWAGVLSPEIYLDIVFPYTQKIFNSLEGKIRIYFSIQSAHLIAILNEYNCEIIGVDWRIPLDFAIDFLGKKHSLQGNLDPALLFSDIKKIKEELNKIKRIRENFKGYIFNLGHGVLPETDIEILREIIKEVHSWEV